MIYTTLDTFYVSDEQLRASPSRKDGVDEETETMLRLYGCELIQESGILLKLYPSELLPLVVGTRGLLVKKMSFTFAQTASCNGNWSSSIPSVLLQEVFYTVQCQGLYLRSRGSQLAAYGWQQSSKRVLGRRENRPLELLDAFSKAYEEMKIDLIRTERHLLKEMGFICHVEHPHKFVLNYLLQLEAPPELIQEGWSLANDSLRTTLCVQFKSEVVACGVVYAAARRFCLPLPENPPWWKVFQAEKTEIDEVCKVLASLYKQPKARYIEVGRGSKSHVLTSKAWDPPPDVQENALKPNGMAAQALDSSTDAGANKEPSGKTAVDRKDCVSKDASLNDSCKDSEEPSVIANGDSKRESVVPEKTGEDADVEKTREKDKERVRDRDREKERDRDRERERERSRDYRDREKERERNKVKERDYRKDGRRDSGYAEKSRHHSSRGAENPYTASRDKERYRHHPYA